jgi:hypothetical protein
MPGLAMYSMPEGYIEDYGDAEYLDVSGGNSYPFNLDFPDDLERLVEPMYV